jgi:hypothetical protein
MNTLINDIKSYALENYDNGYDRVVECYADSDLAQLIDKQGIKTLDDFIAYYGVSIEYAEEIKATAY